MKARERERCIGEHDTGSQLETWQKGEGSITAATLDWSDYTHLRLTHKLYIDQKYT